MTITLITEETYNILVNLQKEHPALTFQNNGFEYINKSKLSPEDLEAINSISKILAEAVKGFKKFFNFTLSKDEEVSIRFDYDWSADYEGNCIPFIGVGYLYLDELLNGFRKRITHG